MRSLTFEKLKNKVGRRSSEPSLFDEASPINSARRNSMSNPVAALTEVDPTRSKNVNSRLRASSISLAIQTPRSRLRSVTKKQAKELIRQEMSQVILKKLTHILDDLGLQEPIPLMTTSGHGGTLKLMKIYLSNTNNCIYLAPASSASFTYEDVENGGNDVAEEEEERMAGRNPTNWLATSENNNLDTGSDISAIMSDDEDGTPSVFRGQTPHRFHSFRLPNYLCTRIDSNSPIPHVFAVIVDLKKDCQVRNLRIEFQSAVTTLWPAADIHASYNVKEKFKIGSLEWIVSMHDADYYISTTNSNNTMSKNVTPQQLVERTKKYKLVGVLQLAEGTDPINLGQRNPFYLGEFHQRAKSEASSSEASSDTFDAGIYVFLVPILLPPQIPASVTSVNGSLTHKFSIQVNEISEKFNRKTSLNSLFNLPMVRTPPSLANSIADKPIYVNRVWNDALHYVITFPRKYVSLGSEHTINVKLVPLVKDVIIKRIKFNVLERITYVSKDLCREYEYDGDDPMSLKSPNSGKTRERVVPICELKTKHKQTYSSLEPFKEEVIKCPDNNILYSCYETNKTNNHEDKSVLIASPLDINIALPFLTSRADKILSPSISDEPGDLGSRRGSSYTASRKSFSSGQNRSDSVLGPLCPSSPVIGSLETHISHMNGEKLINGVLDEDVLALDSSSLFLDDSSAGRSENIAEGYTSVARALAPDSNFRHIQIAHRLQVSFRISKPDPADNYRMHHYEVVVDTPLILLSAKCNDESIQLPEYDEIEGQPRTQPPVNPLPPAQRGITFRMPSYNKNGVSIQRWDEQGDEQLPSFEEAMSTPGSPIMRSFSLGDNSISRMNSLTPSDPAPAYESGRATREEVVSPLNIDDLVIDSSPSAVPRRQSVLKSSLVSSFAPSSHNASRSDNNTASLTSSSSKSVHSQATPPETEVASLAHAPPSFESLVSMISDSTSVTSAGMLSSREEACILNVPEIEPEIRQEDQESAVEQQCDRKLEIEPKPTNDDLESVITHESQFVQKLPLLQNASLDNIESGHDYTDRTTQDLTKMLTDTLNGEVRSQDMFHAY